MKLSKIDAHIVHWLKHRSRNPPSTSFLKPLNTCCSSNNNQPWRFVFVTDKEKLDQIGDVLIKGNAWAKNASMFIAVCSEKSLDDDVNDNMILENGLMPPPWDGKKLPSDGNQRPYYLFDTGLATAFIILRAVELDLVAHPIAGYLEQEVQKTLDIPPHLAVLALIVVGKKADVLRDGEDKRPERKLLSEIAFSYQYTGVRT